MFRPAQSTLDAVTAPYAALLLRVTLGVVFIAHALAKVFVLTLPGTVAFFVAHGFPGWTAYPVFLAELVGGVALVAGTYTRLVAVGLIPVLLGAFTVHWSNGWYFGAPNGGWEYIAVLLAALGVQAGLGDGPFALTTVGRREHDQHGSVRSKTQNSRCAARTTNIPVTSRVAGADSAGRRRGRMVQIAQPSYLIVASQQGWSSRSS